MNLNDNKGQIIRLLPGPVEPRPLAGLYLSEPLRPSGTPEQPFVYATFITSLDGRISLPDPETETRKPPQATTNPRDWRLVQELAASSDVVITTGRYIRDLAAGEAQAGLPVSEKPEFADLLEWRGKHHLSPQPAVAIVTETLDLPIPEALLNSNRPIYAAVGRHETINKSRAEELQTQGVQLLKTGTGNRVDGNELVAALAREGFGNIFMTAGGILLNTLLVDEAFDRLYLTQACRILGGLSFDTLLKGRQLIPPYDFKLRSLYYDEVGNKAVEQLFAVFDHMT